MVHVIGRRPAAELVRGAGPEVIAAASDNDPTNVGTAASVGAHTGFHLSWVALLVGPLLSITQTIAAHVAVVAGGDLQSLVIRRFGRPVSWALLVSVVVVNVVTVAADLQAGAAGLGVLSGVSTAWLVMPLAVSVAGLLLVGRYEHLVAVLRYLLLGFVAFAVSVVLAHPDWPQLLRNTFIPTLTVGRLQIAGALALLGTTLTSYVYVWETIGRGVEERLDSGSASFRRIKVGTVAGGVVTALILWSMLAASAATLGRHQIDPSSAASAAQALQPVAGTAASDLFAIGLVAAALVALPVLLVSSAYVIGVQFGWRRGLSEGLGTAPGFYVVLGASLGLAVALTLAQVPVVSMLVIASVLGGLGTPLGLVLLLLLARDPLVMRTRPISRRLAIAGWVVAIFVAVLGMVFLIGNVVA